MDLRKLVLPASVANEVQRLLAAIEVAESLQAIRLAAHRAEGFVLGMETVVALKPDTIQWLYIGFEASADACFRALRDAE